ncbi:transcriptional regulator, BadM/Rrf2 family [Anaerovirgula multivorans]|uniref:Transcriptional regulator, BadM/Rrf2 family n=1 Tax=Anaerovirgula multivorans TaxID=312168 RepID=A0A239JQJ9_9FIRM|nr:Rrf2 family transcriptional regulator [Anaerovirgula multivorans]SNT08117.1 transcriptional regulator, BadM/Rrf2 family [Anaerovirgula multivorans]
MSSIIHISEMVSIALHGMIVVASNKNKTLLNVKEIAKITGSSESHLSKVMQRLVKANFIRSARGPKGGFALVKLPEEVTLLDIYEAIEGPFTIEDCPTNCKICSFKSCIFGGIPQKLNEEFKSYLAQKSLRDFLG